MLFDLFLQDELQINSIANLYKNLNVIFSQTKILVELILTYPIKSNEGERSFSQLKGSSHLSLPA